MAYRSPYAASRQKSCVACARGKRRCDRQTPQCSRCLAQGLECTYLGIRSPRHRKESSAPHPESVHAFDDILSFWPLDDSLFNHASMPPPSIIPSPSLITAPSLLPAGFFPETAVLDRWSINQLLQNIKSYPRVFGCSRKTPFIHQRLYDVYLPACIQDAFAVSAAYCTKTSATEDMVFRTIESKVGLLVEQDYKEANLQELLAALQALILFHIIQLFDGDVRQRSLAEQNMDILRAWTVQLKVRATELPLPFTWQEWIFEESVRRTVIFSLMLDGLFSTLKKGYCSNVKGLSILPFASKTSLWEAGTAASWLAESHCLASDNVLYGDFVMSWERGRVTEPLDDFQKLLLTPCLGETYREVLELE